MAKGQAQQGAGFGQNLPSWLGMASQYFGGGQGGYGQPQTGQLGPGPPMVADFSHGAGLYQPNQVAPYYAGGGQPPQSPQPPTPTPPLGATPGVTPPFGGPPGLLGSGTGQQGGWQNPWLQGGGLMGQMGQNQMMPNWHNRGYPTPAPTQAGGSPTGGYPMSAPTQGGAVSAPMQSGTVNPYYGGGGAYPAGLFGSYGVGM